MDDLRDRLIELLHGWSKVNNDGMNAESVADYLIENGVILPPCKVGDKVWFIDRDLIFESVVDEILIDKQQIGVVIKSEFLNCRRGFYQHQFGKTVFLTKEEAQKVIEGRSKENDN